jgi:class 3 adenylate cyclase
VEAPGLRSVPAYSGIVLAADPVRQAGHTDVWETGGWEDAEPDRILATILFTDIVESTAKAIELGDRRWRGLLERHHMLVRRELLRFRGREIDTAGDGFLASFDGPARAIRCACAIVESVHDLGLSIRAGLHTGECEVTDGKIAGIAVHTGARVAALAAADEVLVSSTVRDLVAGSGIRFDEKGAHELKGIPGQWRLFAVQRARLLSTERCPWVASHEGGEAFPVVSIGSRGDLRPERGSWPGHVAVLRFDHGPCPHECRAGEGRVQLIELSGGPGQVPGVCGQLCQVHVHQGGSRVLLAPRVGEFHVRGLVSGRGCLPAAESGRPVARFDEVVDQSGHVVLGARCRVAELVSIYS